MIVVVDAIVWVSALQFSGSLGKPGRAIKRASHEATIAICLEIEDEAQSILAEKFGWNAEGAAAVMAAWLPFPLRFTIFGTISACRDPKDDMVLECAVVSGAPYIITGDKDLLALDPYDGIRIVTPADFLEQTA